MPLPSAVKKIGEEAERQAAGMKGAPEVAPTEPVAQPKPAPQPIAEPEDWETRFKNLRSQRNESSDLVKQQSEQIATLQQTVTDGQKQVTDLLARLDKAPPKVSADDTAEAAYQEWLRKVPKRIIDEYDETWLRDQYELQKAQRPTAPKVDSDLDKRLKAVEQRSVVNEQHQEKTERGQYEEAMDEAFPNDEWINLTNSDNDAWKAFCNEAISPVDSRTYGQILTEAHTAADSHSASWVLNQFKTRNSSGKPNPLNNLLTPEGGAGGDPQQDLRDKTQSFTVSQVNEFYNRVAMDVGKSNPKYTPEEAKAIESQIIAAQTAGTILPG